MIIPNEGYNTIDAWRARLRESAQVAADRFIEMRNKLALEVRRSVFAVEVSDEKIREYFDYAKANYDRTLSGVPYFLKDVFDVAGLPTMAGSRFLHKVRPVPRISCRLYQSLHSIGAVFAGKTQMDELAFGLSGENPHYGACPNPLDSTRATGGSSAGSAFAVAAGLAPLAFGTDTAGSIRFPAAACGLFGLRLQPGMLSKEGVFPLAPSFDAAGWFTANARDMNRICDELGYGKRPAAPSRGALWIGDLFDAPAPCLHEAYRDLAMRLDSRTDEEALAFLRPHLENALESFDILRGEEVYRTHLTLLERCGGDFSPMLAKRVQKGGQWTAEQVAQARENAVNFGLALNEIFGDYDGLVLPAAHDVAAKIGAHTPEYRQKLLALMAPASLAKLPVLTLPAYTEDGLSGGLQYVFASQVRMNVGALLRSGGYLAND